MGGAFALVCVVALLRLSTTAGSNSGPRESKKPELEGSPGRVKTALRPREFSNSGAIAATNRTAKASRETSRGTQSGLSPDSYSPAFPDEAKDAITAVYDPDHSFDEAEKEFGVPANLLKAIAQIESQGEHNSGMLNVKGGRGLMGLKDTPENPMLERAVQLLATDRRSVVVDPVQNIRAAAALLRFYRNGTETWETAAKRYSGGKDEAAEKYAGNLRNILKDGIAESPESAGLKIPAGQEQVLGAKGLQ